MFVNGQNPTYCREKGFKGVAIHKIGNIPVFVNFIKKMHWNKVIQLTNPPPFFFITFFRRTNQSGDRTV